MAAKTSPARIGAFVIGAVVIGIVALIGFGGGKFLSDTDRYVIYFAGGVKGLTVGSPVTFRGVKIGAVSGMKIQVDDDTGDIRIPVFIDIQGDRLTMESGAERASPRESKRFVQMLIDRGLKGQLKLQSLVTGQLMVEFDFHPDDPVNLVGVTYGYTELPSIPSDLEQLSSSLQDFPFDDFLNRIRAAAEGIDQLVNAPEVMETLRGVRDSANELRDIMAQAGKEVGPLTAETEGAVKDLRKLVTNLDAKLDTLSVSLDGLLVDSRRFVADANTQTNRVGDSIAAASDSGKKVFDRVETILALEDENAVRLVKSLEDTSAAAREAAEQATKALAEVQRLVDRDSPVRIESERALRDIAAAGRAIQAAADYIQQHPESLLRGKND